jgi:hypothetical protein
MIKGQESQCLGYDGTVRVSNNVIIQTSYGGDDLDGSRLEHIKIPWIWAPNKSILLLAEKCPILQRCLQVARRYVAWRANFTKDLDISMPCGVSVVHLLKPGEASGAGASEHATKFNQFSNSIIGLHARHHSSQRSIINISISTLLLQCAEYWPISQENLTLILKLYAKGIVNPGEGVGPLGATSIGEPSMQMTLNVFHYAGISDKNVTITGLPRFKQLINGVDTYETANMSAKLRNFEDAEDALQTSCVRLSEILLGPPKLSKVPVHPGFDIYNGQRSSFFNKFPADENECLVIHVQVSWPACARRNIKASLVTKSLRDTFGFDAIITGQPHTYSGLIKIIMAPWISIAAGPAIVEALMAQQQVRGIDYVKNTITFQEKRFGLAGTGATATGLSETSRHIMETEGSNILDLTKCPFIVPETIKTSNVVEAAGVLGIAAGLCVLQSELHKVLSFDSSYIDPRHTWLLADTMGRSGVLAAMNRHHMENLGSSLLQRASFEQSLDVFEEGAAFGLSDPLAGATERIITGQPVCMGTGLVGIVSTIEAVPQEAEILVAPLELDWPMEPESKTVVRPLNFKAEKNFDIQLWSTKLMDQSRICSNAFLESCAALFRATAATRRFVPEMTITQKLSESAYRNTLSICRAFGFWTINEAPELVTEVHWTHKGLSGITILRSGLAPTSWSIDFSEKKADKNLVCSIYLRRLIEASDVPFGVEATKVIMRQQNRFSKGHFALTLAREWTGSTNTECEASLLKSQGLLVSILETIESEALLQNRCSDAQLGNALEIRLPV